MKYVKSFNESSSQRLYKYLGETNSPIWANNLRDILDNKIIISNKPYLSNNIDKKHLLEIDNLFSTFGLNKHVLYEDIKDVTNSRFGNCWFFYSDINRMKKNAPEFDICVQTFEDEWYLVNVGWKFDNNNWYLCDQFAGLEQFTQSLKILHNR